MEHSTLNITFFCRINILHKYIITLLQWATSPVFVFHNFSLFFSLPSMKHEKKFSIFLCIFPSKLPLTLIHKTLFPIYLFFCLHSQHERWVRVRNQTWERWGLPVRESEWTERWERQKMKTEIPKISGMVAHYKWARDTSLL